MRPLYCSAQNLDGVGVVVDRSEAGNAVDRGHGEAKGPATRTAVELELTDELAGGRDLDQLVLTILLRIDRVAVGKVRSPLAASTRPSGPCSRAGVLKMTWPVPLSLWVEATTTFR
jgi:hypothetical protein